MGPGNSGLWPDIDLGGGGQINSESLYLPEISYLGRKQAPADSPGSDLLGNSLISVFLTIFVRFCFLY